MLKIEVDCKNYSDFKLIGAGNFGDIYKAKNKKTGNLVAVKDINKRKHEKSLSSLLRETKINHREFNINFLIIVNEEYPNKAPLVFCLTDVNIIIYIISKKNSLLLFQIFLI